MTKDERPYFIQEIENKIFVELAKQIFEELKKKEKVAVYPDDLKEKIFEKLEEKIKEIKEEVRRIPYLGGAYFTDEIDWENSSVEDLLKQTKELFEEIYLFGRIKKFFMPKTGIGVIPDRDSDGNLTYVFYDTKWTFVKRQG